MDQRTILVIDDEPSVLDLIKRFLESKNYKVFTACDGEEGLKLALDLKPGLIILDIGMPKMDGIQFYNRIVINNREKMFPVLVLTGRGEFEALFKDVEADGFIPKPIDFPTLLSQVDNIFLKYKKIEAARIAKTILIIEDNHTALAPMLLAFAQNGFFARAIKSSEELLRQMPAEPLDIVIAKLSLCEVVCALREIPRVIRKDTEVLLYASKGLDLDKDVIKKLCENAGVTLSELVRTDNSADLLRRSKEALGIRTR